MGGAWKTNLLHGTLQAPCAAPSGEVDRDVFTHTYPSHAAE